MTKLPLLLAVPLLLPLAAPAQAEPSRSLTVIPVNTPGDVESGTHFDSRRAADLVAQAPATTAPTPAPASADAAREEQIRQTLEKLLAKVPKPRIGRPALTAGVPSGFGAGFGDYYASITGSTPGNLRNGEYDGSASIGFGVGNVVEAVGASLTYNLTSFRQFAQNGTFDIDVSRVLFNEERFQAAAKISWLNAFNYGSAAGGTPSNLVGTFSFAVPTDPANLDNPKTLLITTGIGGNFFTNAPNGSTGGFAGVGYEPLPWLGTSIAYSGAGVNSQISVAPARDLPLSINLLYADMFAQSAGGPTALLTISFGENFLTPGFP